MLTVALAAGAGDLLEVLSDLLDAAAAAVAVGSAVAAYGSRRALRRRDEEAGERAPR